VLRVATARDAPLEVALMVKVVFEGREVAGMAKGVA